MFLLIFSCRSTSLVNPSDYECVKTRQIDELLSGHAYVQLRQARGWQFLAKSLISCCVRIESWVKIVLSLSDHTLSVYILLSRPNIIESVACVLLISRLYLGRVGRAARRFACVVVLCVVGATLIAAPFAQVTIPNQLYFPNHGSLIPFCVIKRFSHIAPAAECAVAIDNDVVFDREVRNIASCLMFPFLIHAIFVKSVLIIRHFHI